MACSSCAERRRALAEIRRAAAAGDKTEVKAQTRRIGRSLRRDLGRLSRLFWRK